MAVGTTLELSLYGVDFWFLTLELPVLTLDIFVFLFKVLLLLKCYFILYRRFQSNFSLISVFFNSQMEKNRYNRVGENSFYSRIGINFSDLDTRLFSEIIKFIWFCKEGLFYCMSSSSHKMTVVDFFSPHFQHNARYAKNANLSNNLISCLVNIIAPCLNWVYYTKRIIACQV